METERLENPESQNPEKPTPTEFKSLIKKEKDSISPLSEEIPKE